ncbi:MAG: helix-turn-helix domain-containing protein [Bacteroidetes bacterium]|jgi:excisionase family DNA binding protein|nr:helix-turn-helix domain-containing protein [Candidatus Neomarinimicrobiota bacterium]MBT3935986.1 helix-turn-helix domain-containing protein [Bacteroidota bacterium]MBT5212574.1 helix-turn-helix domain-containing protein [Candidatus Neomarinimicrobiota bacterium]
MREKGIRIKERGVQQYYKLKTVAIMLETSERTVRRLIKEKGISTVKLRGGIRIPESEISNLLDPSPSISSIVDQMTLN